MKLTNLTFSTWTLFSISLLFAEISPVFSKTLQINLTSPATQQTWRSLQALSDEGLIANWRGLAGPLKGFANLHWTWRLGWLHACAKSNASVCPTIYAAALKDDAMVVRAKAVQIIGNRYADRSDKELLQTLEQTYFDKRNNRKGQSLRVQRDVLYTLKKLGGESARSLSLRLTKNSPELREYVDKLHKRAM